MSFVWQDAVKTVGKGFKPFVYGISSVKDLTFSERIKHAFVERMQITGKDKSQFYQLFSVLVGSGITSLNSLQILLDKAENERFYRIILTIKHLIEEGSSLSKALGRFPTVFTEAELGVIQAGETVGSLESSFARLSEQAERAEKVKEQVKAALLYPVIVGVVLTVAIIVMVTFVVPQLESLYAENGIELTGITKLLISGSKILTRYWFVFLGLIAAAILLFQIYIGSDSGRIRWHYNLLKLPYVGELVRKFNTAIFTNSIGVLIESGVPIQVALQLTEKALSNQLYKLKTRELMEQVQLGKPMSQIMATAPFLFSANVSQIMAIGESSANLADLSLRLSNQYDEEIQYQLKNLGTVIGPIVIVIVAGFVVLFALAVLLPIFNLTQSVGA